MSANAVPQPPIGGLGATPCATDLELFLDPLLEEPPSRSAVTKDIWSQYEALVARAQTACAGCALLADCMYKAVVQSDVSGFVGCTTPQDRVRMRRALGIKVDTEDLDQYAGTRASRQPVEHDDVLRMRAQHPDEPLESIAGRLGCSLSTVKRHLRRAREGHPSDSAPGRSRLRPPRDPPADGSFDPRRPKGRGP